MSSVVIFGAGKQGHAAYEYCKSRGIDIVGFSDNNQNLWNKQLSLKWGGR